MEINTLVRHKKLSSLGIGCVSKVLKSSVKVNFGTDDVMTCKLKTLQPVDTSKCKTILWQEYELRCIHHNSSLTRCIVGNEVKEFVGIGWITLNVVTEDDLTKYPRVID